MSGIGLDSWLWVIGLSGAGGMVSLFMKLQKGQIHGGLALNVFFDLFTSVIAGGLAFFLAEAAGVPSMAKAPSITIAGVAGARAVTYWVNKVFPVGPTPPS